MTVKPALPSFLVAQGYGFEWREETGSTNADALAEASRGRSGPLWVVAGRQNAGRGRQGRQWLSPEGNLYASLLLGDPCDIAIASQLGFVAGVAIHDAIGATGLQVPRLALKWPNDVLLDGAKIAGLLLEAQSGVAGKFNIVIGFGVNIRHAPANPQYPAAPLSNENDVSVSDLFAALASSFHERFSRWREKSGTPQERFAEIRQLWLERAAGIGSLASVRLPSGKLEGTFSGIDELGRLELRTGRGIETIDAGDLFFSGLIR